MLSNSSILFGLTSANRMANRAALSKFPPDKGIQSVEDKLLVLPLRTPSRAWPRLDDYRSILNEILLHYLSGIFFYRRTYSQLRHHVGVQWAQEQEADQQLLAHRSPHVLGNQLSPIELRRPPWRQDQGWQLVRWEQVRFTWDIMMMDRNCHSMLNLTLCFAFYCRVWNEENRDYEVRRAQMYMVQGFILGNYILGVKTLVTMIYN